MPKKAKDPALKIYTAQFLADTQFWSQEEKGIYITLICVHHQNGYIPKEIMYQVMGGITEPEKEFPLMMRHFGKGDNGHYVHYQTGIEMERRKKYSQEQSRRGKIPHQNKAAAGNSMPASAGLTADQKNRPRDKTEHSYTDTNSKVHSSPIHDSYISTSIDPLEDLYVD